MAKRVDSDAAAEVEITVAVLGNQPSPLAAIKDNIYAPVCAHYGRIRCIAYGIATL